MIVICPGCSQKIEVPNLAKPIISNLVSCSLIVIEHPEPWVCVCGCEFVPVVGGVAQMQIAPRAIERKSRSNLIVRGKR